MPAPNTRNPSAQPPDCAHEKGSSAASPRSSRAVLGQHVPEIVGQDAALAKPLAGVVEWRAFLAAGFELRLEIDLQLQQPEWMEAVGVEVGEVGAPEAPGAMAVSAARSVSASGSDGRAANNRRPTGSAANRWNARSSVSRSIASEDLECLNGVVRVREQRPQSPEGAPPLTGAPRRPNGTRHVVTHGEPPFEAPTVGRAAKKS